MKNRKIQYGLFTAALTLSFVAAGCSSNSTDEKTNTKTNDKTAAEQSYSKADKTESSSSLPDSRLPDSKLTVKSPGTDLPQQTDPSKTPNHPTKNLQTENPSQEKSLVEIDEALIQSCGIRKIESAHLVLYTDIRDSQDIDQFPAVFDKALPQWCEYFSIDKSRTADWKPTAFVIKDQQKFSKARLLTKRLPNFATGYQHGNQMWLFLQPGKYYTRHLLLHEGTHAFMEQFLGGYGAPWYAEGMAELLAVHQWKDNQLKLKYRLRDRSEAEQWGRVRIIQDAVKDNQPLSLEQVLTYDAKLFYSAAKPYAWSWAACDFLSQHPLSRNTFAKLQKSTKIPPSQFTREFAQAMKDDWDQLAVEWQLFVDEMEYGIDAKKFAMTDIDIVANRTMKIDVDRGWQRSKIKVEAGRPCVIRAYGKFQIAHDGQPWISEPHGITIEYHRGRPLGQLLIAVESIDENGNTTLLKPRPLGPQDIKFDHSGWLCFRVNDSPARYDDNQGTMRIEVRIRGGTPKK